MIAENKAEFDRLGITAWHEAGYLGEGITIAVLDVDPYIKDYMREQGVYFDPLGRDDGKGGGDGHTAAVAQVIHEVAPKAHIHMFGHLTGADYVRKHPDEYDIINHSMSALADRAVRDLNIPITQAAGNGGDDMAWKTEYGAPFIIVGAWEEYRDGRAVYSDGGKGLDCMSYTNINIPTKYPGRYHSFNGTSCAAPVVAGMLALLMSKVGKLNAKACRDFVIANCVDLEDEGKDNKTGYGLFVLPDPSKVVNALEIVLKPDNSVAYVNGHIVTMDEPPFIKNNRTYVPLRFVAEQMGYKVDWNSKTKEITIRN